MSFTRPVRMPNVTNVGEGQTATVGITTGKHTFESVVLGLTDIAKTAIRDLEVRVNSKPIQSFKTVEDMEAISGYYGYLVKTGRVVLQFFRKHFVSSAQARTFNLGMADVDVAEVSFDIGDLAEGASPKVSAYSPKYTHIRDGAPDKDTNKLGAITKIRHFTKAFSAQGRFEIDDLPKEMFLQALHLKSEKISHVRLEVNGQTVWDLSKTEMEEYLTDHGRKPQAGWYHLDWMLTNELGGQLSFSGVNDFRLILEMDDPDTVVIYPEYWSGLGGI